MTDDLFELRNRLEETYNNLSLMPPGSRRDKAFQAYRQVQAQAAPLLSAAGLDAVSAQEKCDRATEASRRRASER